MKKMLLIRGPLFSVAFLSLFCCLLGESDARGKEPFVRVVCEESVYPPSTHNNGSGPLWCSGSTSIGRIGDDVYVTEMTLVPNVQPLNNSSWNLLKRDTSQWRTLHKDVKRTREPSPLVVLPARKEVFVSTNPTLVEDVNQYAGPARPEVIRFSAKDPASPQLELPQWEGQPRFNEHSYRSFIADSSKNELLLLNNIGYKHAEWSLRDRDGNWSFHGQLIWPYGEDYEKPTSIRLCYPTVALVDRSVWFCGVSDILEPNSKWAAYKRELTKRNWDYDFRRLFFTWSPDITTKKFEPWLEIASCEKTCGWITPRDLYVAPDRTVYILWSQRDIDVRLREKFFPDAKQSESLRYVLIREGKIVSRHIVSEVKEGEKKPIWNCARFHVTPDGRIWIIAYVSGASEENCQTRFVSENRLVQLDAQGKPGSSVTVPLKSPLTSFFTATTRSGNLPDWRIDLFGTATDKKGMKYIQLDLAENKTAKK